MPTSPRPKQPLSGCSFDTHRGKLRLRYRLPGGVQRAQATGLVDTPANRRRLERTRRLASLRASDVLGLQAELLTHGLSVKYVKNILSGSFRALLRQARIDEEVTHDCFLGITWPKRTRPKPDPLTGDERDRLLAWFATHRFGFHPGRTPSGRRYPHPAFHAYLLTLFWTGLRPSEASGLQWGDIDLRRGRLHVQRSRHLYEYGAEDGERRPMG